MTKTQVKNSPRADAKTNAVSNRKIQKLLVDTFGLEKLRGSQRDVIDAVLRRENTLAVLPTGAGKSLCFQLPALMIPGTTLVISPLIALMKDQQEKLEALEIESLQLNSSLKKSEQTEAIEDIKEGKTDFIYTTPERLADPEFLKNLKHTTIDFVVIDEAHCITQWGHDFRPAYLGLRDAIKALGQPPILALTATATEAVSEDIQTQLGLDKMTVIRGGLFRDNLHYEAQLCEDDADKLLKLDQTLDGLEGQGVIYCSSIKAAKELHARYSDRTGGVEIYHGKLGATDRSLAQDRFMSGDSTLMIATNAFGMGIDKGDLRFVIHFNFPGSLEAYYQETGRAGRDSEASRCILLYLKKDQRTQNFFLAGKHPNADQVIALYRLLEKTPDVVTLKSLQDEAKSVPKTKVRVVLNLLRDSNLVLLSPKGTRLTAAARSRVISDESLRQIAQAFEIKAVADKEKLKAMVVYAQSALCRWNAILKYFGEKPLSQGCQACDNCERDVGSIPNDYILRSQAH